MKMKKNIFLLLSIFLTGCGRYKTSPLPDYSPLTFVNSPQSNNDELLLAIKEFDKTDCRNYLDRNVINAGYQPIQLFIRNNSGKTYYFSPNMLDFPCITYDEIASGVYKSTIGNAIRHILRAIFSWPLVIPVIYDGIQSAEATRSLFLDFDKKTARDELIYPGYSFNKLIFIPIKAYNSSLTFLLKEVELKSSKEFDIQVNGENITNK